MPALADGTAGSMKHLEIVADTAEPEADSPACSTEALEAGCGGGGEGFLAPWRRRLLGLIGGSKFGPLGGAEERPEQPAGGNAVLGPPGAQGVMTQVLKPYHSQQWPFLDPAHSHSMV